MFNFVQVWIRRDGSVARCWIFGGRRVTLGRKPCTTVAIPEPMSRKRKATRRQYGRMPDDRAPAAGHQADRQATVRFCALNANSGSNRLRRGNLSSCRRLSSERQYKISNLTTDLRLVRQGIAAASSSIRPAGFRLPNKAMRSPDVSWITRGTCGQVSAKDGSEFHARICPDFVLELRSRTDRLPKLHEKDGRVHRQWRATGLADRPAKKQVFVYRPGEPVEHLQNPATLSGEPVLAGFTLDLARVW